MQTVLICYRVDCGHSLADTHVLEQETQACDSDMEKRNCQLKKKIHLYLNQITKTKTQTKIF
jgi:hypothetical protein